MTDTIVLIPARMAATRFPGKPLADIAGQPMIVRVMERAHTAGIGPVVIASGDSIIEETVTASGGVAVATDPNLRTGTDRIAAALHALDPHGEFKYVINLQGDLPTIPPEYLSTLLHLLKTSSYDIVTLVSPIHSQEEVNNTNVVKAVLSCSPTDQAGRALYFSRQPICCADGRMYHHIGVYGFRRSALEKYVALPSTPLEQYERLEHLRALESGMTIGAGIVEVPPFGVDTPEDLERARAAYSA